MHVLSSHIAESKSTGRLPILFMVAEQGKFPCPRLRLKNWFHETGLVVPSRVSLLTLYTNAESGAYSRDSSRCLRRFTTIHHRVTQLRTDGVHCREYVVSKHFHCCFFKIYFYFSLSVASAALTLVFMSGLYPTAYRAAIHAFLCGWL